MKELHLTEDRGTGFLSIYNSMERNGSPVPIFETDDQTYVVTLTAHECFHTNMQESAQVDNQTKSFSIRTLDGLIAFINQDANQITNQVLAVLNKEVHGRVLDILEVTVSWIKGEDIFKHLGLSNQPLNRNDFLDPLINVGWIQLEYPDELSHSNQRYKIMETGRRLLSLIKK